MLRAPNKIRFVCESCNKNASVRKVRRWAGTCGRCDGTSWKLAVEYSDTVIETSYTGLLLSLFSGAGTDNGKTYTNQTVVEGIEAEVASYLTVDRSQVTSRVLEYVRLRDQQKLLDLGGKFCKHCNTLYRPVDSKPWTHDGYCSKLCVTRHFRGAPPDYGSSAQAEAEKPDGRAVNPMITVVCPNGHEFDVATTWSGCKRPCTSCNAKTLVP